MVVPVPGMPFTPSREETMHFCQLSYGAELRPVVWQWPGILNDSLETYTWWPDKGMKRRDFTSETQLATGEVRYLA